jgi:hypothetical protein
VTWFFPPTIRDMVIEPSRWAQLDIKELASLSHYAGVALYEICARYKDVPGGLTNRAEPSWWVQALRSDPDTKPREWRKFKNETLKPAVAEISQRTGLEVRLVEYKQGRAVVEVQFAVKRKPVAQEMSRVDLSLVEQAAELGIRERDLDLCVDEYGEELVHRAVMAMQGRQRAQPTVPINSPLAYLRKALRNGVVGPLFEQQTSAQHQPAPEPGDSPARERENAWLAQRKREINEELDELSAEELEEYAEMAKTAMAGSGVGTPSTMKRFAQKQYRSPLIWEYIRSAYASVKYGPHWKVLPQDPERLPDL